MNVAIDVTNVVIKTERLVLRAFQEDDLNDFYEYASVDGVGERAGWLHHKSIDETIKILDMFINEKKTFAITLDGKVIGSLGIERYNEDVYKELKDLKAREIGYVLAKKYWKLGYMTEAVKATIKYLFNEVKLDAITCSYFVENKESARVQEKCGFRYLRSGKTTTYYGEEKNVNYNILYKQN